ncbi:MAG: YeeE/YedE family protein [Rubrivivax sp.]|nr:YeeE/YedE family protein [Rubrivivax sp.]
MTVIASLAASLLAGLVFGIGLIVSGMADPAKVLGFLDLAGAWDPSLAFVMVGAIAVCAFAFAVAKTRTVSFLGAAMKLPASRDIDRRLVIGSALFGIGWGVAGFCPGPGLVALGMLEFKALVFVVAMLVGMGAFELIERRKQAAGLQPAPDATVNQQ